MISFLMFSPIFSDDLDFYFFQRSKNDLEMQKNNWVAVMIVNFEKYEDLCTGFTLD